MPIPYQCSMNTAVHLMVFSHKRPTSFLKSTQQILLYLIYLYIVIDFNVVLSGAEKQQLDRPADL